MKRHKHMVAVVLSLAMALTSLFVPAGIYAADGTIQVGVPVSGTVSSEVKPSISYWSSLTAKENPYYQNETGDSTLGNVYDQQGNEGAYYSEYFLTVDTTGFYLFDYSDNSSLDWSIGGFIILDADNVAASSITTGEYYEDLYVYLHSGTEYRVIVWPYEEPEGYNFSITATYCGDEISDSIEYFVYDSDGNVAGWDDTRLSWTFYDDGLLTVQGWGELFNEKGCQWSGLVDLIKEIEIKDGITSIEAMQFYGLENVEKVTIPSTVTRIGPEAFAECTGLKEIVFNGDAPVFEESTGETGETWSYIFYDVTATAYYPAGNSTWTEAVRQNYDGNITWFPKELEPGSYYDVSQNAWYHDAVKYAGENNLMSGVGGGNFDPDGEANRAMITTILYRMEGTPQPAEEADFTDVAAGSYYADAVAWASSENIVSGYSQTLFAPEDRISRQQLATMLYRYAQYKGYDVSDTANLSAFDDSDSIASYAEEAVSWAVAEGLISGTDDTTLSPEGTATRAQIATILMRFCESIAA